VIAITVPGSTPRSDSIRVNVSTPPWTGSMSTTASPDANPHRTPTFASGYRAHIRSTTAGSVVASRNPRPPAVLGFAGSFPRNGNTGQPWAAYCSAAFSTTSSV